jgi:putative transposase
MAPTAVIHSCTVYLGSTSAALMLWRYSKKSAGKVGFPRVDQGTEFVSRDLDLWAYQRGVTLDFSRPGKPTDNAFIESFNGKFRAECLNAHWF